MGRVLTTARGIGGAGTYPPPKAGQVIIALRVVGLQQHLQEGRRGDGLGAAVLGDLAGTPHRLPLAIRGVAAPLSNGSSTLVTSPVVCVGWGGPNWTSGIGAAERRCEAAGSGAVGVERVDAALRPGGCAGGADDHEWVVRTQLGRQVRRGRHRPARRVQCTDTAALSSTATSAAASGRTTRISTGMFVRTSRCMSR